MANPMNTYPIEIGGVKRDLRLFEDQTRFKDCHPQYPGRY